MHIYLGGIQPGPQQYSQLGGAESALAARRAGETRKRLLAKGSGLASDLSLSSLDGDSDEGQRMIGAWEESSPSDLGRNSLGATMDKGSPVLVGGAMGDSETALHPDEANGRDGIGQDSGYDEGHGGPVQRAYGRRSGEALGGETGLNHRSHPGWSREVYVAVDAVSNSGSNSASASNSMTFSMWA